MTAAEMDTAEFRWPLEPLAALIRGAEPWSRVRVDRRTWTRARTVGLSADQADRWSIRAGYHPAVVWPDLWDATAGVDADGAYITPATVTTRMSVWAEPLAEAAALARAHPGRWVTHPALAAVTITEARGIRAHLKRYPDLKMHRIKTDPTVKGLSPSATFTVSLETRD